MLSDFFSSSISGTSYVCYNSIDTTVTVVLPSVCYNKAINVSVQYYGGFLPDIILLTQCYYHRGTHLNAMKRFCIFSY